MSRIHFSLSCAEHECFNTLGSWNGNLKSHNTTYDLNQVCVKGDVSQTISILLYLKESNADQAA